MNEPTARHHAHQVLSRVDNLDPSSPDKLPKAVSSSWVRCATDYRLDPSQLHAPVVLDHNGVKERHAQHGEVIDIARAEMDSLYEQISGSGYALLLTDANGVILREKVDPAIRTQFRGAGLIIGADWSEQYEGTNGIGTCIAERRPVTIHRTEHFRARHIGLTCSGSPIRDVSGELMAVLDASCVGSHDTRASQMHTMALVNMSARVIEKCLFLRRFRTHRVLRFHSRPEFVNLLHDGAIAIREDGVIVAVDNMAVALLAANSREDLIGRRLGDLFDVRDDELDSQATSAPQALWPLRDLRLGRRYYVSLHAPLTFAPRSSEPRSAHRADELLHVTPRTGSKAILSLEDLAGDDSQMLRNARCARRIAASSVPVLVQGPTGSGKEAFARALHLASTRAQQAFVAVNCAAIPETLIESELFGYRPGAFTGARREGMRGRVLQASGGTLFLDEIGDMPLALQTRLLRVLEEQEVTPLGSETPIKVDLRVVSASHRNLRDMISHSEFREDLYYRLNGITLHLPALCERQDRERLIREFLASETPDSRPAAIEMEAFERLLDYGWPGNIRELRNVLRTALAICEGDIVRLADLPTEVRFRATSLPGATAMNPASAVEAGNPLETAERHALLTAIEANRWNMTQTAQQLDMSRNTLYRKLRNHGIAVSAARRDDVSQR